MGTFSIVPQKGPCVFFVCLFVGLYSQPPCVFFSIHQVWCPFVLTTLGIGLCAWSMALVGFWIVDMHTRQSPATKVAIYNVDTIKKRVA